MLFRSATAAYAVTNKKAKQLAIIQEQWEVYNDLLNVTENLEKAIGLNIEY